MQFEHAGSKLLADVIVGKSAITSLDGCWEWKGYRNAKGYGRVRFQGKDYYAHRLVWMCRNGRLLEPHEVVMHQCHNPSCVNPLHLSVGNILENNRQRLERGGYSREGLRRASGRRRVLTAEEAAAIKLALKLGQGAASLAIRYGKSVQAILDIKSGKTWSHLTTKKSPTPVA
jgi:hypothetical protein